MTYTNLNLPEATVKLLAEKGGIKCLADGDIAVKNDNLEALRKVLKAAFPEDSFADNTTGYVYYTGGGLNSKCSFMASYATAKPSVPASILVKELEEKPFEWGERVWVSDDKLFWKEGIYLRHVTQNEDRKHTVVEVGFVSAQFWKHCQREKPKPLRIRITPEMIKEKFNCQEFEIVNEKG